MAIFIISYDLNKDKDYERIITELKRLDCIKPQRSLWLGSFDNTSEQLLAHFKEFIDEDDNLIVAKIKKSELARYRTYQGTNDWLANHSD